MGTSCFDKHLQFIQEMRQRIQEPDSTTTKTDEPTEVPASDEYDLYAELDRKFMELYGSKKKIGQ